MHTGVSTMLIYPSLADIRWFDRNAMQANKICLIMKVKGSKKKLTPSLSPTLENQCPLLWQEFPFDRIAWIKVDPDDPSVVSRKFKIETLIWTWLVPWKRVISCDHISNILASKVGSPIQAPVFFRKSMTFTMDFSPWWLAPFFQVSLRLPKIRTCFNRMMSSPLFRPSAGLNQALSLALLVGNP